MNIIFDLNNNHLRQTGFNDEETYALTELKFFIPTQFNYHFYCFLKDTEQMDVIQLVKIKEEKGYGIYMISTNRGPAARCDNLVTLSLGYNLNGDIIVSDSFLINLDYSNYNYARQINAIAEVSEDIANKYLRIEEMTKININLFNDIQEVGNK